MKSFLRFVSGIYFFDTFEDGWLNILKLYFLIFVT